MSDINNKAEPLSIRERNSLYALALELESEEDNEKVSIDTILKRLKSESGIINLLKRNFDFDIEKISARSDKDKYEMYELLKVIYKFKFKSDDKSKPHTQNKQKAIIKLFSKPSLENLNTEYSQVSKFGDVYTDFSKKIKPYVDDAEERYSRIYKENIQWEQLIGILNFWVIDDNVFSNEEHYDFYLNNVDNKMESLLLFFKTINQTFDFNKLENQDGVFKTFFNLLTYYEIICNNSDKIKMNRKKYGVKPPDKKYIDQYREIYGKNVDKNELEQIEKHINNFSKLSDNELWKLITYNKYNENEASSYRFAIKHYKTIVNWIYKRYVDEAKTEETPIFGFTKESDCKNIYNAQYDFLKQKCSSEDFDIRELPPTDFLVAIFQELAYIHEMGLTFENKHLQYTVTDTPLTKVIKDEEFASATIIRYIIRRIENRLALNLGVYKLMEKKRKIETKIYQLKEVIFKYQNIDDMEFISQMLSHFLWLFLIEDEDVANTWARIYFELNDLLIKNNIPIDIVINEEKSKSIMIMCKELSAVDLNEIDLFIKQVSNTFCWFNLFGYICENERIESSVTFNITSEVSGVLYFSIHKDQISFDRFEYECDEKIYKKIDSLGLYPLLELLS